MLSETENHALNDHNDRVEGREKVRRNGRQNATKRTPEGMLGLIEACNS